MPFQVLRNASYAPPSAGWEELGMLNAFRLAAEETSKRISNYLEHPGSWQTLAS